MLPSTHFVLNLMWRPGAGTFRYKFSTGPGLVAHAGENTTFIETARAVQSIKLFNRQIERTAVWLNRYAEVVRNDAEIER